MPLRADVVAIEPLDVESVRRWWEIVRAADAERPVDDWPSWEVARVLLTADRSDGRRTLFLVWLDGQPAGAASLWTWDADNTHLAQLSAYTLPEVRRRGVASAAVDELERRALLAGRTVATATAFSPLDEDSAGLAFARARGYAVASIEETKLLDLAACAPGWVELDRDVSTRLDGYRIEVVEEPVPDAWVDDLVSMLSVFVGMVPMGDLDVVDSVWTAERLRAGEARALAAGRTRLMAVAVDPDGRLCGFSDLRLDGEAPIRAMVGGTLVLPEHRGHRLGLAMKLASHRLGMERFPSCTTIETGNAGVNTAMNAVNDLMGYRVVERAIDVHRML